MRWWPNFGIADVPGRLAGAMQSAENVLMLFGTASAGVAFYVLSAKRRKSPAA